MPPLLRTLRASASRAGLRVYLGYARGVGTTLAMLEEANRRNERGPDVVVAAVNTEARAACGACPEHLEILGGRRWPVDNGDVADLPVFAAAPSGGADAIIAGDRDLLDDAGLRRWLVRHGTALLTPAAALRQLDEAS